jgi:hypothetical protein
MGLLQCHSAINKQHNQYLQHNIDIKIQLTVSNCLVLWKRQSSILKIGCSQELRDFETSENWLKIVRQTKSKKRRVSRKTVR